MTDDEAAALPLGTAQPVQDGIHRGHTPPERPARREVSHKLQSYPLFFCKNYSAQVLKANMKIVGATEFAVVLYRDKLPKFRNVGEDGGKHMVFDWFRWERDSRKEYPKIHPTQKPVGVLKRLIEVFTDPGDVVIDPVAGSGTTLRAAYELGRSAYGFEVDKSFYEAAREKMLAPILTETTTI